MEEIGCATPFGPFNRYICKDNAKALKAANDIFKKTMGPYSRDCSRPCTFLTTRVIVTQREKKSDGKGIISKPCGQKKLSDKMVRK